MIFLKRGVNDCKIVIPNDAHVVEKTASEELVNYIEKSLGIKLSVVPEKDAEGKCIYVGHTEFAKKNSVLGKSKENWIIKMVSGNLVLTGGVDKGDRGIIYSVYHFLEDIVGVRWWTPFEEDVLTLDSLSLDDDLFREGTPFFRYRKTFADSMCGVEYFPHIVRGRGNVLSAFDDGIPNGVYDEGVRKYGDVLTMGRPHHVHTMEKYFPPAKYYDEHPEWWAWNKALGKHLKEGHRCLSNEEFINAFLEKILAFVREDVELAEKTGVELPTFYSITMDDLMGYCFCQCPECSKTIEKAGYSGYVLKFVNRIAREVAKVYPAAKIETLAYLEYIKLPKDDTLPEKNVIIRMADVYIDLARGVTSPTNAQYLEELRGWSELCKKAGCELFVWDYLYNIQINYPLPIFKRLKDTVLAFAEYGVSGVFVETEAQLSDSRVLNNYLMTRLLENPYADEKAIIDDFLDRYYGKEAGRIINEYYDVLEACLERNKVRAYCCEEDSPFNYIDAKTVIEGSAILDRAEAVIGDAEPYRTRLNWLRKPLDTVIANRFHDFKKSAERDGLSFKFDFATVRDRAIAALVDYRENPERIGISTPPDLTGLFEGAGNRRTYEFPIRTLEGLSTSTQVEIDYLNGLSAREEVYDIPEELKDVACEDIYQFPFKDIVKFTLGFFIDSFGYSLEEDAAAAASKVMKICYDKATGFRAPYALVPTSKNAETKQALLFELCQENRTVGDLRLYVEDITTDAYSLYKLGTVSGISKSYSTRVRLPQEITIDLTGLAVTFPMDECDVYFSMKATGAIYGGSASDENAIYLDRMIVVRKK